MVSWHVPLQNSSFYHEIMKSFTMSVAGLLSCDVILGDFSHELFVLHVTFMNVSLYWDSHQPCIRLQIGAVMCALPTADAVYL